MSCHEISVIVSTFQRPRHLERCLLSLYLQEQVAGRMEVVVADDGSTDATAAIAERFARHADLPLSFTTHEHEGFQLAKTRNEGVLASAAPYLLFVDGDCVLPPDHVRQHLDFRSPGTVVVGDCVRLDQETSARVDASLIRSRQFLHSTTRQQRTRLRWKGLKGRLYTMLGLASRPRMTGNNIGIAREDFERVNGFDEAYRGWGLEDRDLQRRLARAGLRFRSIVHRTVAYHLWHEPVESFSRNNENTANLEYFRRGITSVFCQQGLRLPYVRGHEVRRFLAPRGADVDTGKQRCAA